MKKSILLFATPRSWVDAVMSDFDAFLLDHAAAEKKASSMAMTMISHYPDKPDLVEQMTELAIEELNHFREIVKVIYQSKLQLGKDSKDSYVGKLRDHCRNNKNCQNEIDYYFMDRLLIAGIIEARGHERFGLIADALDSGPLKDLYRSISLSEERHYELFFDLACFYFDESDVSKRKNELLLIEADITKKLPVRSALH